MIEEDAKLTRLVCRVYAQEARTYNLQLTTYNLAPTIYHHHIYNLQRTTHSVHLTPYTLYLTTYNSRAGLPLLRLPAPPRLRYSLPARGRREPLAGRAAAAAVALL